MKRIVYDVAANEGGGGETILDQYMDKALRDEDNEWWFFVSISKYKKMDKKNVHVIVVDLNRSIVLKKYILRKKYELWEFRRAVKRIDPDEIISLQNMPVKGVHCRQIVYLHQSFQFSPVKYKFLRKEERAFAFRQRVICPIIRHNLKLADQVIVQTKWMKRAVSKWAGISMDRIIVESPKVVFDFDKVNEKYDNIFIYPANAYLNKNHKILIEACKYLKRKGFDDYSLNFTLSSEGRGLSHRLLNEINESGLPIRFIGHLNKDELFEKYQSEVLLFPSYIETFGLPLLESKQANGRIIASDEPFAHEILDGYKSKAFVGWDDVIGWAKAIMDCSKGKMKWLEKE